MARYIVFITDSAIETDLVLSIESSTPKGSHGKALAYYQKQGWDHKTIQHIHTVRLSEKQEIQQVGRLHKSLTSFYQEKVRLLCEKLFEVAQSILNDEGNTAYFDELIVFLKGFPEGKQVVDEYYYMGEEEIRNDL